MSTLEPTNIALVYDDDAYVELVQPRAAPAGDGPVGLMGRQVAGKEFLDAYLTHGSWTELTAVVRSRPRADALVRLLREHPSSRSHRRALRLVEEPHFHARFLASPPAPLLYAPCPPDERFAWARQHGGPGSFALCGVTHTLASAAAAGHLCSLLTAPFEPFDALICTSRAVVAMVRAVTGAYADYLQDRHGGRPALRPRLETIPLGVNTERFRPATPEERAAARQALGAADDEVVVLFVGRLSHHAKAHPFPMYVAAEEAARAAGRKVHLVLAGWAAHPAVHQAFLDGARAFAPSARLSLVDGTRPDLRAAVWHAADVFVSLADNVQETFGLVIVEAMASGLPVVASDWDGYRDLVAHDETGLLVTTRMVGGATASATSRLLFGELNYDLFLAECSQAAAVDPAEAGAALARLVGDDALRRAMGEAGRRRAVEHFDWAHVVRAYEELWRSQEAERRSWQAKAPPHPVPARYPAPEHAFAGYPTRWLHAGDAVSAAPDAAERLSTLLTMPLTNLVGASRVTDEALLREALAAAAEPCPVAALDDVFGRAGVAYGIGRATVAWLLKYGLLRAV